MQGKTINGYTLQRPLGTGGMAEVWLAENAIGKKAAVKLLLPRFCGDEGIVARFHNEAKVMVQLDHPNIRQVYDYGNLEGRPVIVMEYLEGDDLKAMMKQGRRFNNEELVKWWNQIADALNYTHQQGIVHRDIKPSNIFLDRKGNIKLLDFGIAKIKESISMTQTGAMMGTLMYMSPEQVEDSKHIGPESDVYSLAVSFVHLLTGKAPYDSTTSSDYAIRKGIVELPLDLSALPEAWRNFLAPYLAKKPEDRPELRPFELVEDEEVPQAPDEDEGTVVAGTQPEPEEPARAHPTTKQPVTEEDEGTFVAGTEPKETPTPSDGTKKSKTGLWIGIGAAVVAVVLAVLLLTPKNNAGLASTYGSANGHDYVDLGLPSGTLWATCNIGASKPEDYGNYYAWGETQPQASNAYDWSSYKYANGTSWDDPKFTKYCDASDYGNNGFTDDLTELLSGDDPAAANWGGGWRTPTKAQWDELLSNTTHQWTTQNGVSGRLFTSKNNGQTLFLPAAGGRWDSELHTAGSIGDYWSRSLDTVSPNGAWYLYFRSGDGYMSGYGRRLSGFTVRPVRQK